MSGDTLSFWIGTIPCSPDLSRSANAYEHLRKVNVCVKQNQWGSCIRSLKKNPAENYMAPDPANFLHQLPQKESGRKLYGSRSRQLSASAPSKRIRPKISWLQIPPTFRISPLQKNPAENYMAPDPANFLHQLPHQKESGRKLYFFEVVTILGVMVGESQTTQHLLFFRGCNNYFGQDETTTFIFCSYQQIAFPT